VKEQVFAALRQHALFVVPKSLVEIEAQNMVQRMSADMREQGMKAEDITLPPEKFHAAAENRVALGLILAEVVRNEGLGAKPEQVKALVQEAAQTYEQPDAVVRWHYEKPERCTEFEGLAVEHNVVAWVLCSGEGGGPPDGLRRADGNDPRVAMSIRGARTRQVVVDTSKAQTARLSCWNLRRWSCWRNGRGNRHYN
jgi:hypothetical protein